MCAWNVAAVRNWCCERYKWVNQLKWVMCDVEITIDERSNGKYTDEQENVLKDEVKSNIW